jgi:hypothetical protein
LFPERLLNHICIEDAAYEHDSFDQDAATKFLFDRHGDLTKVVASMNTYEFAGQQNSGQR